MRIREQLALATSTGTALGVADGIVASVRGRLAFGDALLAVLLGAGTLAMLALGWGLIQAGLVWLFDWFMRFTGARDWLNERLSADRGSPRAPVVRFHAALIGLVVSLALLFALHYLVLARLATLTDEKLARILALVELALGLVAAALLTGLVARLLHAPLTRFDERFGLPFPRRRPLRVALCVAPLVVVAASVAVLNDDALASYRWVFWLALFVAAEVVAALAFGDFWKWSYRTTTAVWTLLAIVILSTPVLARLRRAGPLFEKGRVTRESVAILRLVTDVDRDGASSFYAGGDCAGFNRRIGPLARDEPGNGIDENCDGTDSSAGRSLAARRFHGAIAAHGIKPRKLNVVWWIVDAARGDRCSVIGYDRPTTPYLESIARESLVFTHAFSQSSATMLSIPSMLIGLDPATMRWEKAREKLQAAEDHVTIAERLKQAGYRTLMVSDRYLLGRLPGLHQGFDKVADSWLDGRRMPWYRRHAAVAASQALKLLTEDPKLPRSTEPFFLLVYSADPHDPYDDHAEGFPDFGEGDRGRYDREIAFTDRYVGFLIDYLRYQRPLWENTAFVFTADHGEEFGEHGGRVHGYTCNREGVHVPLVVRVPGMEGRRIERRVALLDIVPTLLEVLGIEAGDSKLDGQSLFVPAFSPGDADPARPILCASIAQSADRTNFFRRSLRTDRRTLLHDAVTAKYELYASEDLLEKEDLVARPEEAEALSRMKDALTASMTGNLLENRLVK